MPTATSNYARRVLFDPDGEALDFTDTNNMQLFEHMRRQSLLLSGVLPNVAGDPSDPGSRGRPSQIGALVRELVSYNELVYALHVGAAMIIPTGTARTVAFTGGAFMAITDEPWNGGGEEMATFDIPDGLGMTLQVAVGDATHPRVDIVEVKLEYVDGDTQSRHFEDAVTRAPSSQNVEKERRVQMTYQIKQGTPAASPAYPAPTAGYAAYAAIYVPAGFNTTIPTDNIRDMRQPLGVRAIDVPFTAMLKTGANPWVELGGAILATAAASTPADYVYAICPVDDALLLGVGVHGSPGDDQTCTLVRLDYPQSNAAFADAALAEVFDDDVFNADGFTYADQVMIMDRLATAAVHKGTRVASTRIGTPLWCNGSTCGVAQDVGAPDDGPISFCNKLALRFSADGTGVSGPGARVSFVRFYVAEGL